VVGSAAAWRDERICGGTASPVRGGGAEEQGGTTVVVGAPLRLWVRQRGVLHGGSVGAAAREAAGCSSSAARIEREIVKKSRGLPADTWEMELGGGFGCLAILNPSRGSAVVVFFVCPRSLI